MGGLSYPLLSDFWPHGKVAVDYGVLRAGGITERAVFIVDTAGIVRYVDVHDIAEPPPPGPILSALDTLGG
jgi:alkyl hydroperoxide reductase subunit AhpC